MMQPLTYYSDILVLSFWMHILILTVKFVLHNIAFRFILMNKLYSYFQFIYQSLGILCSTWSKCTCVLQLCFLKSHSNWTLRHHNLVKMQNSQMQNNQNLLLLLSFLCSSQNQKNGCMSLFSFFFFFYTFVSPLNLLIIRGCWERWDVIISPGSFVNSPQSGLSPAESLIGTCSVNNNNNTRGYREKHSCQHSLVYHHLNQILVSTATQTRSMFYTRTQTHCNCEITLYVLRVYIDLGLRITPFLSISTLSLSW